MATLFADIYEEFLENKVRDVNLATRYTPDALSGLLSNWLKDAREVFRDIAIEELGFTENKMEDVVPSTRSTYSFVEDGETATLTLDPKPETNSEIYVSVNGIATTSFTFTSPDGLEVTNMPDQTGNEIYVGAYKDGQFNQTLNLVEIRTMTDLMQLVFMDVQTANEKLLNQRVYGKDYGLHSQANHINAMEKLTDKRYMRIVQRMNLYSYRQDPEELARLGGIQ